MYIKIGSDGEELDSAAVSLQNGSLMWTETTEAGGKEVVQLRMCTATEFYDAERQICAPCPAKKGTHQLQQPACKSCGDMWYDSKDSDYLTYQLVVADQLCENPEQVYADEHPELFVEEEVEEVVKEEIE